MLKIKRFSIIFSMAMGLFFVFGLICLSNVDAKEPLKVFVSILPQKYFVKQIAGDLAHVLVMVEPGASPATYEPKPGQMKDISSASIYFSIGVPFEKKWLNKVAATNPDMRIIHTDHGIQKLHLATNHLHDDKGSEKDLQHRHEGFDPHIWLSPPYVILQARQILIALQEVNPEHQSEYEKNYKKFIQEIIDLDAELRSLFKNKNGLQFMVFHPSWGYFAHAYGLKQISIEIEGKEPKPAQLRKIIKHAKENRINVILVQPQFSAKSASLIAREINGKVVFADPLAENWAVNLKKQSELIKDALR